jgi:UDP-glucuronate 4-epimerase
LSPALPVLSAIICRRRWCGAEKIMLPMQAGDVPATFADIDDLARDHGYAPTTSIDVGIPAFVDWYRTYKNI